MTSLVCVSCCTLIDISHTLPVIVISISFLFNSNDVITAVTRCGETPLDSLFVSKKSVSNQQRTSGIPVISGQQELPVEIKTNCFICSYKVNAPKLGVPLLFAYILAENCTLIAHL